MKAKYLFLSLMLLTAFTLSTSPLHSKKSVITLRSGTVDNDDIAEPLSKDARKYKAFLDTSNRIVKFLKLKKWPDVYSSYFHPEFARLISSKKFRELNEKIHDDLGPIESFQENQWFFALVEEGGKDIIISVKIVHHRAAVVYYRFTFYHDNPKGMIGFYYNVKHLRVKVKD